MSGQYPGGYNNPLAGHRGQFNPQQQQMMNQMQMGSAGGAGMMGGGGGGPGSGMMSMGGGGYGQGGMMPQQQGNPMQQGMQGMSGPVGGSGGGMGPNVMSSVGMQSPSHVQQQLLQQQQQQMQQQQMGPMGPQMGMGMAGHVGMGGGNPQIGNIMQQQQQLPPQMQQNVSMQQAHQMQAGPSTSSMGAMMAQQQQQQQQQQPQQSPVAQQQQQQQSMQQQQQLQQPQQQMPQSSGQQQQQASSSNSMLSIPQQPHKEINIVTLSRVGQETVQDITSRFQEIFTALKVIQPTASRDNGTVKKVQEHFRTIRLLFKRMRLIYERCSDGYPQGMEYTHVESLIPYKDETEHRNLEATQCEEYRKALQENQELIDTVKLKNRQLREIIDRTRIIVWEINTMLSMRRS